MKEKERLTPFQRLRDHHENFDNFCFWLEGHWEDVVLYGLSTIIIVLTVLFFLILCNACSGLIRS